VTTRDRDRPRRSCLSVPGSNDKMLTKAVALPADMVIIDLEDAVVPAQKDAARAATVEAVRALDWGAKVVCIRINDWTSPWTVFDALALVEGAGARLDEVMLPKVESAAQVVALDLVLAQAELRSGLETGAIGIVAQLETARGIADADAICGASPRVRAVVFGPADYAASVEMPVLTGGVDIPEYPGDHFNYVYSKLLIAGRMHGLQVLDGPYLAIRDLDGLRAYSQRTRALGFDGKWALHPDQLPIINEVFSPTQQQFDRAWEIIEACERAAAGDDGRGAVALAGEMIDEASRKMASRIRAKGERAGLERTT
jgi:citrate lyase subunit beta/citryl-CoA lyase